MTLLTIIYCINKCVDKILVQFIAELQKQYRLRRTEERMLLSFVMFYSIEFSIKTFLKSVLVTLYRIKNRNFW